MRTSAYLANNKVLVLHDGALHEYVAIDTTDEENVSIDINPQGTVASILVQSYTLIKVLLDPSQKMGTPTYILVDTSHDTLARQIVGIAATDSFDLSAVGEVHLFVR